jgi:hypothetical protein
VLNFNLDSLLIELKDGSIKNVGPANKSASAKLFDVEEAGAREFGDSQLKITATDESGNEVQIALFPEQAEAIVEDVEAIRADGRVFE